MIKIRQNPIFFKPIYKKSSITEDDKYRTLVNGLRQNAFEEEVFIDLLSVLKIKQKLKDFIISEVENGY